MDGQRVGLCQAAGQEEAGGDPVDVVGARGQALRAVLVGQVQALREQAGVNAAVAAIRAHPPGTGVPVIMVVGVEDGGCRRFRSAASGFAIVLTVGVLLALWHQHSRVPEGPCACAGGGCRRSR